MSSQILVYPSHALLVKSLPQDFSQEERESMRIELSKVLLGTTGVGLAAPQIGINKRVFVLRCEAVENCYSQGLPEYNLQLGAQSQSVVLFIEPKMVFSTPEKITDLEGCLSFPSVFVHVDRSIAVGVQAMDVNGKLFNAITTGTLARAIQHEMDHLDGITLVDHVSSLKKASIIKKLKRMEKYGS